MNTLPRAATARFFPDQDSYNALRAHWSVLINSERRKHLSAAHHLLYLAMLGKDWRRAFTPPTNRRKLENGAFAGWSMFRASLILHNKFMEAELLAPFDGRITPAMLDALRSLVPLKNSSGFRAEQFAPGVFPFDAYLGDGNVTYAITTTRRAANV